MSMMNQIGPAYGARKKSKRVGRGPGSGLGKTCGKGHKGQKARSGNQSLRGFEGGQTPLQRRLPKFGFTSRVSLSTTELRLSELNKVDGDVVSMDTLRSANLIPHYIKRVKIFLSGEISKAVKVEGIKVTKGAKEAIVAAGGQVVEG